MNKKVRVTLTTIQPPMETLFFFGQGRGGGGYRIFDFCTKKKIHATWKKEKKKSMV
jgi:hypothetical protein